MRDEFVICTCSQKSRDEEKMGWEFYERMEELLHVFFCVERPDGREESFCEVNKMSLGDEIQVVDTFPLLTCI